MNYAPLASPTFTGVPAAPTPTAGTNTTQIATTAFVAAALASVSGGSSIYISDTTPTGAPANSLWWESDTGMLYVNYNDGDSTQWVAAVPVPDTSSFLLKNGGTMTGLLVLSADPTAALGAATKQYVDSKTLPSGTVSPFFQAAAPTGWTQVTTHNDKALRVVSGTGGVAGGTNSFSSVMAQTVVGNHTQSIAESPSHTHTPAISGAQMAVYAVGGGASWVGGSNMSTDTLISAGGGGAHNHPIMMSIQYIDLILASKN
jgi:hypothetical protein